MKRTTSDSMGRMHPRRARSERAGVAVDACDVGRGRAGRAAAGPAKASCGRDPGFATLRDAELLEEFVDFLQLPEGGTEPSSAPDPLFQERLRSRLWRMHVLARLRTSDGLH